MRVVGNSNGVVAGGATERRLGVVSVDGGDISWIPTVGNPSAVQFTADGSLLWAEGSANGKTRDDQDVERRRRAAHAVEGSRRALVLADRPRFEGARLARRQVGRVRQRSQRLDSRLRHAGERHVGVAGEAADDAAAIWRASAAGRPTARASRITAASPATRWSASSTSSTSRPARASRSSPSTASTTIRRSRPTAPAWCSTAPTSRTRSISTPSRRGRSRAFVRLSDSMPAGLDKADLTPPVAVSFPSRLDKKPVPASLMVSKTHRSHARSIRRWSGFTARDRIRTSSAGIRAATGCTTRSASTSRSRAT